ncbi:MAG: hypothetical protein LBE08_07635 [Bifidobacteriaceae bacterium]|nr:hypothetical protein [Bifidobacteriaceae bacterium]
MGWIAGGSMAGGVDGWWGGSLVGWTVGGVDRWWVDGWRGGSLVGGWLVE